MKCQGEVHKDVSYFSFTYILALKGGQNLLVKPSTKRALVVAEVNYGNRRLWVALYRAIVMLTVTFVG